MPSIEQKARDATRPAMEAVGKVLAGWRITPNSITYLGLILTAGVAALAAVGALRWAGAGLIVAALCDALDGAVARASGKGSRFGAFLDSTVDRFEEALVFLGLLIYYTRVGGPWEIPLTFVATVGSLMVSYTRARAEGLGVACKEGFMTRAVRVVVLVAGLLLHQVLIALIVLAAASLFTSLQRVAHVWRMTGGEKGGWSTVKEPFVPAPPVAAPSAGVEGGGEQP